MKKGEMNPIERWGSTIVMIIECNFCTMLNIMHLFTFGWLTIDQNHIQKSIKHVQVNAISDFKNWHANTRVMWEWKVVKGVTLHRESKFIQSCLSVYALKYLQSIQFLSLSPCNPPLCILLYYFRGEIGCS
jgi:hypothetical protein